MFLVIFLGQQRELPQRMGSGFLKAGMRSGERVGWRERRNAINYFLNSLTWIMKEKEEGDFLAPTVHSPRCYSHGSYRASPPIAKVKFVVQGTHSSFQIWDLEQRQQALSHELRCSALHHPPRLPAAAWPPCAPPFWCSVAFPSSA